MSQWHRNNPELYESGYEPWDDIEAQADELRKERRLTGARAADPDGPCTCGYVGPDEFGNYELIEASDCPFHGAA